MHKMYADLLLGCFVFAYAMYVWIDFIRKNKHDKEINAMHVVGNIHLVFIVVGIVVMIFVQKERK